MAIDPKQQTIESLLSFFDDGEGFNWEMANELIGRLRNSKTDFINRWKKLKNEIADLKKQTPWDELTENGWMIVGMNHYNMNGERHLFCSMSKNGKCIVAEGVSDLAVFESLRAQGLKPEIN